MQTSDRVTETASPRVLMPLRDRIAIGFFATWMITGLFIDGWAHERNKPETFFSPWHGVLYSGFAAAVIFFLLMGVAERRRGVAAARPERLTVVGFVVFVAGAVGDGAWHQLFGIEVDLEALLSPTHLSLMIGGLLMLGAPVRAAWAERESSAGFSRFLPVVGPIALAVALVSFFMLYLSAFHIDPGTFRRSELREIHGVATILSTNVLFVGAMMFVLTRWTPPAGTFTFLFGVPALFMSGIHAFEQIVIVPAAFAGGVTADLICRSPASRPRRSVARRAGIIVPCVMWLAWFALYQVAWGVGWAAELWVGSTVLAAMSGAGLSLLAFPPAAPAEP